MDYLINIVYNGLSYDTRKADTPLLGLQIKVTNTIYRHIGCLHV